MKSWLTRKQSTSPIRTIGLALVILGHSSFDSVRVP
ncbi:hypothetical protein PCE31106_04335 [Pandoraea cepalis]|uniref:Uncharacterized protein n=2 Tax=Pandoraea TaxID=93217 RepID=A0A5E4Y8I9_9BURK|nr:hypothetical protein PSO31014_00131 [Pandoraea soli]VVE44964.1 hypothetical protein PCE31106_04335 [Pandoraea cepalis]